MLWRARLSVPFYTDDGSGSFSVAIREMTSQQRHRRGGQLSAVSEVPWTADTARRRRL
jgi:hypothetical protein